MRSRPMSLLCLPLLLGALAGCAGMTDARRTTQTPLQRALAARTEAVENARIAFQAAKAAGSETAAPFEYYMAQEYLQLAQEELASGDKDGVAEFAAKSKAHSITAIDMAKGGTK